MYDKAGLLKILNVIKDGTLEKRYTLSVDYDMHILQMQFGVSITFDIKGVLIGQARASAGFHPNTKALSRRARRSFLKFQDFLYSSIRELQHEKKVALLYDIVNSWNETEIR